MDNCIFCGIATGKIPSKTVYEDEFVLAFHDINPQTPTHILIIPKMHLSSLMDITEENAHILSKIHLAALKIARELNLDKTGFRLINNCGSGAGQTVFHLHYHLLAGGGLGEKLI